MKRIYKYLITLYLICSIQVIQSCEKAEFEVAVDETETINVFEETTIKTGYRVNFEYDDGQENTAIARAYVPKEIFYELGFSEQDVLNLIQFSVIRSMYQLRYPRSFKLRNNTDAVFVTIMEDEISLMISAIGSNAMGVESHITIIDKYSLDGEHIGILSY